LARSEVVAPAERPPPAVTPPTPPPPPPDVATATTDEAASADRACGGPARRWSYSEGSQAFARVARGWTRARVTAALGPPSVCERDVWTYIGGPYTGPEVRYRLTFARGVVAAIERSSVGCRVVE